MTSVCTDTLDGTDVDLNPGTTRRVLFPGTSTSGDLDSNTPKTPASSSALPRTFFTPVDQIHHHFGQYVGGSDETTRRVPKKSQSSPVLSLPSPTSTLAGPISPLHVPSGHRYEDASLGSSNMPEPPPYTSLPPPLIVVPSMPPLENGLNGTPLTIPVHTPFHVPSADPQDQELESLALDQDEIIDTSGRESRSSSTAALPRPGAGTGNIRPSPYRTIVPTSVAADTSSQQPRLLSHAAGARPAHVAYAELGRSRSGNNTSLRRRIFAIVGGVSSKATRETDGGETEGDVDSEWENEEKPICTTPGMVCAGETETETDEPSRHLPTARVPRGSSRLSRSFSFAQSNSFTTLPWQWLLFEFSRLLAIVPASFGFIWCLWNIYTYQPELNRCSGPGRPVPDRIDYIVASLWALLTAHQCLSLSTGLLTRWRHYYAPLSTLVRLLALQGICWPATQLTVNIFEAAKRPTVVWALIGTTTCMSRSIQIWVVSNLPTNSASSQGIGGGASLDAREREKEREKRRAMESENAKSSPRGYGYAYWKKWNKWRRKRRWDWKETSLSLEFKLPFFSTSIMDKTSSIVAAFDAGKLPSTQQFDLFFDWLSDVGITRVEPSAQGELSSQGRLLANDLRRILDAYKEFLGNKNEDNILQEAIWHLEQGDLVATDEAKEDREQALKDIHSLQRSLRVIMKVAYNNIATEGSHIFSDFASVTRLMLADAAELVEAQAGKAKDTLRRVEQEVQEGKRDTLGRDKEMLEAESSDARVTWEHGMDSVKDAGSMVIDSSRTVAGAVEDKAERTTSRLQNAFYSICDRAQSDPAYRHALDTVFTILQKRLDQGMESVSDPNFTLATFIADPTPEQHVPKAIECLKTFFERIAGVSLDPLARRFRATITMIVQDNDLKSWFDDFISELRRDLSESGYVRSDDATRKRKQLRVRWKSLLEKDEKWKVNIDALKEGLDKAENGFSADKDLQRIRTAHQRFNSDIEQGLIDASKEAETGLEAAMEQVTWFWQDLFKVYLPRVMSKMKDVPIPRIEYKDQDLEFVLENLDISSFNILPSHVYIRNITDVDIQTSAEPSEPSRTAVGALTQVRVQAIQMTLNDVSFWYKDKTRGSLGPGEFTGLLHFDLPEKGLDLDLKLRLIPATVKGPHSRENLKHFNVIEKVEVKLADDIGLEVRDSNHSILVTLFKPVMILRLREALERTLTEQVRAAVEWTDGIAFDIAKRKEVFQDTGLGGGGSLMAAIWSEAGRIRREGREKGELGVHATGTGLVVEQQLYSKDGRESGRTEFAMGAEPQILSGDKRGPLGTASTPLRAQVEEMGAEMGVPGLGGDAGQVGDVAGEARQHVKSMVKEGKKQISSFKKSVEEKTQLERQRPGWQSAAFDV
ncbi:hypothetical protein NP233_g34 [Leucocoprinus birnbaumii]|uniref:Uncharacterized protein n=1 Tax=Leucocoprinus birnbaumii TaxID=56174 RepID=A0AAD5W2U1_9AGAR|nr:hypothetical protein NP233_g34 [Leucocoprinus birnbaumii]